MNEAKRSSKIPQYRIPRKPLPTSRYIPISNHYQHSRIPRSITPTTPVRNFSRPTRTTPPRTPPSPKPHPTPLYEMEGSVPITLPISPPASPTPPRKSSRRITPSSSADSSPSATASPAPRQCLVHSPSRDAGSRTSRSAPAAPRREHSPYPAPAPDASLAITPGSPAGEERGMTRGPPSGMTATSWDVVFAQPASAGPWVKHGVDVSRSVRTAEDARRVVYLLRRMRVDPIRARVGVDYCFSSEGEGSRPRAYVTCASVVVGEEVSGGKWKGMKVGLARKAMEGCLRACVRHNAGFECGCSLPRLAGRKRESVPVWKLGEGEEVEGWKLEEAWEAARGYSGGHFRGGEGSETCGGLARKIARIWRDKKTGPSGEDEITKVPTTDGNVEQVNGSAKKDSVPRADSTQATPMPNQNGFVQPPPQPVASTTAEKMQPAKPKENCCTAGCLRAEMYARLHDKFCSCGGLGERIKMDLFQNSIKHKVGKLKKAWNEKRASNGQEDQ
ncbi:hypothetical protein C1H76_5717 [Elsinoe australis]|uniref:Uncharacterized protein n=1 Tax=Elsinoe australis TaxID=40998 RepID=A0A4U7B203_9PEZI|nr:hypothetical protein C1H76_5717 [Elsinoe australis]